MKTTKKLMSILIAAVLALAPAVSDAGQVCDQGASGTQSWVIFDGATLGAVVAEVNVNITTPTLMTAGIAGSRKNITIQNNGANLLRCGFDTTVSSTHGFIVPPVINGVPGSWSMDLGLSVKVYCVCPGGTQSGTANSIVVELQ